MPLVKARTHRRRSFRARARRRAGAGRRAGHLSRRRGFLADARELVLRQAPTGVIWPNDRRIAELAPLSRLGSRWWRWCSRPSATAAPTARRGCLRERYDFRGELRATGQVLRDQFLFLHRAGFDAFEVTKDSRRRGASPRPLQRYSVFYQPTGDGRLDALRTRLSRVDHRSARSRRGSRVR